MSRLEAKFPIIGRAERVYSLAQAQDDPTLLIWDDKHFSSHGTEVDFTGGACRGATRNTATEKEGARVAIGYDRLSANSSGASLRSLPRACEFFGVGK
jgi:hypothetical protein